MHSGGWQFLISFPKKKQKTKNKKQKTVFLRYALLCIVRTFRPPFPISSLVYYILLKRSFIPHLGSHQMDFPFFLKSRHAFLKTQYFPYKVIYTLSFYKCLRTTYCYDANLSVYFTAGGGGLGCGGRGSCKRQFSRHVLRDKRRKKKKKGEKNTKTKKRKTKNPKIKTALVAILISRAIGHNC